MPQSVRVLVVDDDHDDRELVARVLRRGLAGATVTAVGSAEEFTAALQAETFDLVTTDYWLSWGDGLTVIAQVSARMSCPILMVTGAGNETVAADAIKAGASDYVLKIPSHLGRLPAVARRALVAHQEHRATVAAERRFRNLFEGTPIAVALTSLDGKVLEANPAFAELLGFPDVAAAVGHSMVDRYVDPADRIRLVDQLRRRGFFRDEVVQFRRLDGSAIWVQMDWRLIRSESGDEEFVQAAIRDISESVRAREQLNLQASALAAVGEAIAITDASGTIEWVNPAFSEMTGYEADEVRGQNPRILKSGLHDKRFYEDLWRTIGAGRVWRGKLRNRRKDGGLYFEEMSITPVRDSHGQVTHFVAVKRDVTAVEVRDAQVRQAQKMEAVGHLAGGVAHDFNNLLTAILGYSELLLDQFEPGHPARQDVGEIQAAGKRASALTRQLLAFSRRQPLRPTGFDLREVVGGLDSMLRRLLRENIAVRIERVDTPTPVEADVAQVEEAIFNLAVNASDAMPDGGTLTLRTAIADLTDEFVASHPGSRAGRFVLLEVQDTGEGIEPELLDRIFDPFFTTKPQGKGTGLGLSMVYGFIKQSGGYVGCDSARGRGSTFSLYFPLSTSARATADQEWAKPGGPGRARILLAEDDASVRDLVDRVLRGCGFEVIVTASAEEALRAVEDSADGVDLLITDIIMPNLKGTDLARRLKKRWPKLPVIFISGYHDAQDHLAPVGASSEWLLNKPFATATLLDTVRLALGPDRPSAWRGGLGYSTEIP